MARIVMKFGGTSVADLDRIRNVAQRVQREVALGNEVAVVVSAMSGVTNTLVKYCQDLSPLHDAREYDAVVATGENVTAGLTAIALQTIGVDARSFAGWQIPLTTDGAHGKARIDSIDGAALIALMQAGQVPVVAGFQGIGPDHRVTTLGRGGSDTSAVALAAALGAERCDIYTDVDGVYTTDPRIEPAARRLATITFEEMLELASQGSKVLQIRSVEFAGKYKVKLRVLSSFTDTDSTDMGTLITFEEDENMEQAIISGIAFNRDEAKITVLGVPDKPGVAFSILGPIADANIEVDVIIQNVSHDGITDFSFTVHRAEFKRAMQLLEDKVKPAINARSISGDDRIAKVSLVGIGMRTHAGVASKMFGALAREGINIQMISTSEIKTSVVVDEKYMELAVRVLHREFELDKAPTEEKMKP